MLQIITGEQENNFNDKFKLKIYNNLLLKICCESIVKILLLKKMIKNTIATGGVRVFSSNVLKMLNAIL